MHSVANVVVSKQLVQTILLSVTAFLVALPIGGAYLSNDTARAAETTTKVTNSCTKSETVSDGAASATNTAPVDVLSAAVTGTSITVGDVASDNNVANNNYVASNNNVSVEALNDNSVPVTVDISSMLPVSPISL